MIPIRNGSKFQPFCAAKRTKGFTIHPKRAAIAWPFFVLKQYIMVVRAPLRSIVTVVFQSVAKIELSPDAGAHSYGSNRTKVRFSWGPRADNCQISDQLFRVRPALWSTCVHDDPTSIRRARHLVFAHGCCCWRPHDPSALGRCSAIPSLHEVAKRLRLDGINSRTRHGCFGRLWRAQCTD